MEAKEAEAKPLGEYLDEMSREMRIENGDEFEIVSTNVDPITGDGHHELKTTALGAVLARAWTKSMGRPPTPGEMAYMNAFSRPALRALSVFFHEMRAVKGPQPAIESLIRGMAEPFIMGALVSLTGPERYLEGIAPENRANAAGQMHYALELGQQYGAELLKPLPPVDVQGGMVSVLVDGEHDHDQARAIAYAYGLRGMSKPAEA